jgi:hypothetical protein
MGVSITVAIIAFVSVAAAERRPPAGQLGTPPPASELAHGTYATTKK